MRRSAKRGGVGLHYSHLFLLLLLYRGWTRCERRTMPRPICIAMPRFSSILSATMVRAFISNLSVLRLLFHGMLCTFILSRLLLDLSHFRSQHDQAPDSSTTWIPTTTILFQGVSLLFPSFGTWPGKSSIVLMSRRCWTFSAIGPCAIAFIKGGGVGRMKGGGISSRSRNVIVETMLDL